MAWSSACASAPYRPSDDDLVLERLPLRPTDPVQRELARLRAAHQKSPGDVGAALELAKRYFNLALDTGDARYVGYAQAALQHWQAVPLEHTAPDVLVLRAQLEQYRHHFDEAVALLNSALAQAPGHVRALTWRAAVNMVVARYDAVRGDCALLRRLGEGLLATGCMAYLDATLGRAGPAYDSLSSALASQVQARPTLKFWTLTVLAEIARRRGETAAAEAHYRSALALDESDQYAIAAYAELLFQLRRWRDAQQLLSGWERSDVLLPLLARAERALGEPQAQARAAALRARFAAAALRADPTSAQDEAWFRLEFENDPKGALALALKNWSLQKEPRDAEIVLQAALASHDPGAANPVLQWMAHTGIEDPQLRALAAALSRDAP